MTRGSEARWVSILQTLVAFVLTHQAVFIDTYGREVDAALLARRLAGRAPPTVDAA
jgi:hypothetical protein